MYLLKIDEVLIEEESYCTVLLEIGDVGGWVVKFRQNKVIVNNR